ncbi:MAG: DinB family protein [Dermatophilaceae bacterium]
MSTPYIEQPGETQLSQERADLLDTLGKHRMLLRVTVRDLTDEQAGLRSTVSELCLGGLVKHVASTEATWVDFIERGPVAFEGDPDYSKRAADFQMLPGDTLEDILRRYEQVAARTDSLVRSLASLDHAQPLPPAPWFPPNATWSARRVFIHIVAETAQHAGHADILREAIDGAKSMG